MSNEQMKMDADLRQIVTEALVGMVSGVTGLVPPTGPGAIPDFIQAPIDRAVERISASLPVGVPDVATLEMKNAGWRELQRQGIDPEDVELQAVWHAMYAAAPAAPTVKAEQADDTVEFGFDDRAVRVSQEAYAIFLDRESALRQAFQSLQYQLQEMQVQAPSLPAAGSAGVEEPTVVGVRISSDGFGSYIADSAMGIGASQPGEVREPLMTVAQCLRMQDQLRVALSAPQSAQDVSVPKGLLVRAAHTLAVGMFDGDKECAEKLRALLNGGEANG
jgi:hypothetical protein